MFAWFEQALQTLIDFLWLVIEPVLDYLADLAYMVTVIIQIVGKILTIFYMFIQLLFSTAVGLIQTAVNFISFEPSSIPSSTVANVDVGVIIFSSLIPPQIMAVLSGVLILMFYLLGAFAVIKIIGR